MLQSPGLSSGSEKRKKDKKLTSEKSEKPKSSKSSDKPSKSVEPKPSRSSADARINELDKKWADRFNRLEALLLSKSLDQPEPTFQAPKVAPTHPPTSWCCQDFCTLYATFHRPTSQFRFSCYQPFNPTGTGYQANRLRLLSRNVLLLQTCPEPTTLHQRGSILASRLKFNPTPADLQIYLAPALLLYIRLPTNRP